MIAGRGTPDQGPAHALKAADRALFVQVIDLLTEATIEYLSAQVEAGAEVVKLFDSWAGSLKGADFIDFAVLPAAKIIAALKARHPGLPVIAFPREAGQGYVGFAKRNRRGLCGAGQLGVAGMGGGARPEWTAACKATWRRTTWCHRRRGRWTRTSGASVKAFSKGPHIFNLGHGITPDADPENVARMVEVVRRG
jgi:uroporphyrinogen decarboxylase